jgi:hypothetical protein
LAQRNSFSVISRTSTTESDESFARIEKHCRELASKNEHSAASIFVKELFVDTIGEESATTTVFRCVHQGLVMPLAFVLRAYTRLLVKDLKSKDGWRVRIDLLSTGGAAVTHVRREQSFGNDGSDAREHFVMQLETTMRVDRHTLNAVSTRISHVDQHNSMLADVFLKEIRSIYAWNEA